MQAPQISPRGQVPRQPTAPQISPRGDRSASQPQFGAGIPWELRPKPSRQEITTCNDRTQYLRHLQEVKRGANLTPIWEVSLVALTADTENTLGALVRHHTSLTALGIHRSAAGGADAMALLETTGAIAQRSIAKLSRAIVTSKSLIELRLIDVNINEPAFIYLAHAIAQSKTIKYFDFSQNKLLNLRSYGPVHALALMLERNVSLTWLNLHRTTMSKDDLSMLMHALKVNTSLLFVDVSQTLPAGLDPIQGDDVFRYNQVLLGLRSDKWRPASSLSADSRGIFWRPAADIEPHRNSTYTFQSIHRMQEVVSKLALSLDDIALPGLSFSGSGVPNLVMSCMMLRRLVLSNTGISVLPASISAMRALSELHVSHNKLQELPAGMSALTSLERLFAADNLLVSASPLLKLSLLHTLDLSRNQLRSIGSFEWPHLVMLDLSHNDLRSLPTVIGMCANLRYLNVSKNPRFDFFPLEFSDICQNFIPEVALFVGGVAVAPGTAMPNPVANRSGTLPSVPVTTPRSSPAPPSSPRGGTAAAALGRLLPTPAAAPTSPAKLVATSAATPPPSLSPRGSPRSGTASAPPLDPSASSSTASLPQSQPLDMASALTPGVGIPLMLSGTLLGRRLLLVVAPQLKGTEKDPAPLVSLKVVEKYLKMRKRWTIDIDAKLLLIGEGNAGKTTLLSQLSSSSSSSKKKETEKKEKKEAKNIATDGIDIKSWKAGGENGEPVQFRSWDFAGQEDYMLTHQFFLTKRSIYLVVFDLNKLLTKAAEMAGGSGRENAGGASKVRTLVRTDRDPMDLILYWLNSIRSRANAKVPVFLVGTHADELKGFEKSPEAFVSRLKDLLQSRNAFARFANIQQPLFTLNTKSPSAVIELKSNLVSCAQKEFGGKSRQAIPSTWFMFVQHLKKLQSQKFSTYWKPPKDVRGVLALTSEYWMKWNRFREVLSWYNIPEEEHQSAAEYFHETGHIVFLSEEQWSMKEHVFLHPQWLTNLLKTIFTLKHNFGKSGILRHAELQQLWKEPEYPADLHSVLRGILERLEVLYHVKPQDIRSGSTLTRELAGEFVIPSLLPDTHPDLSALWPPVAPDEILLGRIYELDFMPTGLFSRFLIRMFAYTDVYQFWRTGVLLGTNNAWALVVVSFHTIEVRVRGTQPLQLLGVVLRTLDALLSFWYHVDVSRYVPCICSQCRANNAQRQAQYSFPVTLCEAAVTEGQYLLECEITRERIRLDKLMPDLMLLDVEGDSSQIQQKDLEKKRELGKGAYGQIFLGTWKGREVAIKEIYLDRLPSDEDRRKALADFRAEIKIMSSLKHPNVVAMMGYCVSPPVMVMELVPCGDLYGLLHDEDRADISWKMRLKMAVDIAEGMAFLHSLNPPLLHRDLKSPNILLASLDENAPVVAKVADFGLSSLLVLKGFRESATDRRVENPTWQAPEVLGNTEYSQKADVYAFGIILHEIATRMHPFEEFQFRFLSLLEDSVQQGVRPTIPSSVPPAFAQLITKCWQPSPADRPFFVSKTNVGATVLGQLYTMIADLPADQQPVLLQQQQQLQQQQPLANNNQGEEDTTRTREVGAKQQLVGVEGVRFKRLPPNGVYQAAVMTLCVIMGGSQIIAGGCCDGSVFFWALSSGEMLERCVGVHMAEVRAMIAIEDRLWSAGPLDGVKVHELQLNSAAMRVARPNFEEFSEWLEKKGGAAGSRPYQKRYFILRARDGILTYHTKPGTVAKGEISLLRAEVKLVDPPQQKTKGKEFLLELQTAGRVYWLRATDADRRKRFADAIESVVAHHPADKRPSIMRSVGSIALPGLTSLTLVGSQVWLACSNSACVKQYDSKDMRLVREIAIPAGEQVNTLLSHGKHVWCGLASGQILRIEKQSGSGIVLAAHGGRVTVLISALDNVWSASADGAIKIWNAETGQALRVVSAQQRTISAMVLVGGRVWSAGEDCSIKIWDAKTQALLKKLEVVHTAAISSLLLVFGRVVWSAGQDATVNLWK